MYARQSDDKDPGFLAAVEAEFRCGEAKALCQAVQPGVPRSDLSNNPTIFELHSLSALVFVRMSADQIIRFIFQIVFINVVL